MASELRIYYQDKLGGWQFGLGGFYRAESAIEPAKDLSEHMKTKTRIVDAITGRLQSLVEVVLAKLVPGVAYFSSGKRPPNANVMRTAGSARAKLFTTP